LNLLVAGQRNQERQRTWASTAAKDIPRGSARSSTAPPLLAALLPPPPGAATRRRRERRCTPLFSLERRDAEPYDEADDADEDAPAAEASAEPAVIWAPSIWEGARETERKREYSSSATPPWTQIAEARSSSSLSVSRWGSVGLVLNRTCPSLRKGSSDGNATPKRSHVAVEAIAETVLNLRV
jgi:hypothetical protein